MTVEEYERMAAAGVLDDPRVELINGYLVKKMGKSPPHIWAVDAIIEALRATLPHMWCRKEDPVRIPDFDEPEPDVTVVRGNRDDYRDRIPEPKDVVLLVEVAESTLDRDQDEKRRAYASGGILEHQPRCPPGRGLLQPDCRPFPIAPGLQARRRDPGLDRRCRGRPDLSIRRPASELTPQRMRPLKF